MGRKASVISLSDEGRSYLETKTIGGKATGSRYREDVRIVDALKEKLAALFDVIDRKAVERNYGGVAGRTNSILAATGQTGWQLFLIDLTISDTKMTVGCDMRVHFLRLCKPKLVNN